MKERPILFSAPMVRAILDGRKTQTRRLGRLKQVNESPDYWTFVRFQDGYADGIVRAIFEGREGESIGVEVPAWIGDRLWVKETHQQHPVYSHWVYRADYTDGIGPVKAEGWPWRPSIFMPRRASRITLEVIAVRVERLQDISIDDAESEGLKKLSKDGGKTWKYGIPDSDGLPGENDFGWPWHIWRMSPVDAYQFLWESINGPGSWDANPWVWVIEFRRVHP